MYFTKILALLLIFVFKYNSAFDCSPCTYESTENGTTSVSCSNKTTQINKNIKINQIPPNVKQLIFNNDVTVNELDFEGQNFHEINVDLSVFIDAQKVVFSHNLISDIRPNCLDNLTVLRTLYLDNNQLTVIPLELFKNTLKIEHIFLHNNKIKILHKQLFESLPYLTEVHLNENNIERIEDNCFVNVPSLKILDLNNNNLTSLTLNFIDRHDALIEVYFEKNPWLCNITLCDVINTSLEKNWLKGRIPTCYNTNGGRNWNDLQILEPIEILDFQSPTCVNQNVVLVCQVSTCSFPSMFWSFRENFQENATHCIDGYKHTLTNVLNEVVVDDEGFYTCLINNCTFCGNSSRYLRVIDDVDCLNAETTTDVLSTSDGITQTDVVDDAKKSDEKIPDIKIPCFICLIIGIFVGIIIGILIVCFLPFFSSCCCCIYKSTCFLKLFKKEETSPSIALQQLNPNENRSTDDNES